MREYKECYIAYLDLLGFKNSVNNKSCEEIAVFFDKIEESFITTVNSTKKPLFDHRRLKRIIMSDSICLYIEADVKNALAGLIAYCCFFQVRMARLNEPVLVRGAIVKGEIYNDTRNKNIVFGPGLVKAYLMEEKTAKYPRIIFTKSLLTNWKKYDDFGKEYVNQFTFSDKDEFCVIDFLYLFYGLSHEKNDWKSFVKHIQTIIDFETDSSIREKYLYLFGSVPRAIEKFRKYIEENNNA